MRCCIIPIAAHGLQFFDPTGLFTTRPYRRIIDDHREAARSLRRSGARSRAALLPLSYTTTGDLTHVLVGFKHGGRYSHMNGTANPSRSGRREVLHVALDSMIQSPRPAFMPRIYIREWRPLPAVSARISRRLAENIPVREQKFPVRFHREFRPSP